MTNSPQEFRLEAGRTGAPASDESPLADEGRALLAQRGDVGQPAQEPEFVVIKDPFPEASEARRTPTFEPFSDPEDTPPPTPRRWTVAIDLTSTTSVQADDRRVVAGADSKAEVIRNLAEQTRGVPVTLYVQAPVRETPQEDKDGVIRTQWSGEMATYRIENGEVTLVERAQDQGMAQNLERLISRASQRAGDGNLGVVLQSHGYAGAGVGGDTGKADLAALQNAISNGLERGGSDRTQLDLLNFDSCSMGSVEVMAAMRGSARHIVGSAEVENVFGDVDGQNMNATLSALLENPNQSAEEFGTRSIDLARSGANDDVGNVRDTAAGTETLAHFNTEHYPQFERSLASLGGALTDTLNNPEQRQALINVIDSVEPFSDDGAMRSDALPTSRRDTGLFLDALEQAIADNKIVDTDSRIRNAIQSTRESMQQLISNYHGEPYHQYDRMSGMSMFLPGNRMLDFTQQARTASPIGMLQNSLSNPKFGSFGSHENFMDSVQQDLEKMGTSPEVAAMMETSRSIGTAGSEAELRTTLERLNTQLTAFAETPAGAALIERQRTRLVAERDRVFNEQLSRLPPEWRALMSKLT